MKPLLLTEMEAATLKDAVLTLLLSDCEDLDDNPDLSAAVDEQRRAYVVRRAEALEALTRKLRAL
jgi:uncharacterized protein with von Willebrand factor type A (vWA) domain